MSEAVVHRRTRELLRVARHPDLRRIETGFGALAIADNATWIAITIERSEFLTALTGHPQGLWSASERAQRLLYRNPVRPTGQSAP